MAFSSEAWRPARGCARRGLSGNRSRRLSGEDTQPGVASPVTAESVARVAGSQGSEPVEFYLSPPPRTFELQAYYYRL